MSGSSGGIGLRNFVEQLLSRKELKEETLGKLTVASYNETEEPVLSAVGSKSECYICLEVYCLDDKIVQLPCKHIFCRECIFKWLKENVTCPLCRNDVK